ncbi:MFS transporter [Nocardioides sp. GCM10027113]|uniref:MFS transporter n=1 Tax=unclassified Nocardioides TaxID=2615069 RepID=UPI0036208B19
MTTAAPANPSDPAPPSRRRVLGLAAAVTPRIRLLVGTLLVFNVGFYMVVPFLAVHLTGDLGVAAGVVGTVLGLRMLSQQGLFLAGGILADALGVRATVLAGIALRVASFLLLGTATELPWVIAGVVALGVAGALFTPAIDALVAEEAEATAEQTGVSRTEVFALHSLASQAGSLVGPAIGALLVLGGFTTSCLVAAAVFAVVYFVHWRALPRRTAAVGRERPDWGHVLGNRRFLLFAVAFAGYLALYNQLYLAVPLQLLRDTGSGAGAGWVFSGCAVLVLLAQLRITARARHLRVDRALGLGFALMVAGGVAAAALAAPGAPWSGWASVVAFAGLVTLGQMVLLPASRDAVARLAGERMLATHYGLVSTVGGVGVLLVSVATGAAFDTGDPVLPWLLLAVVAAASGLGTAAVLRGGLPDPRPAPVPAVGS